MKIVMRVAPAVATVVALTVVVALLKTAETGQTESSSGPSSVPIAVGDATWHERYTTVEDAVRAADEVVLAVVTSSRPGRVISAGGVDLPFTNVELKTMGAVGGTLRAGDTFVLELTGGQSPRGLIVVADDPPYSTGDTYFLLLRKSDVGYTTVSPVGRFVIRGGVLKNISGNAVGQQWSGRTAAAALQDSRRIREQR